MLLVAPYRQCVLPFPMLLIIVSASLAAAVGRLGEGGANSEFLRWGTVPVTAGVMSKAVC